MAAPAAATTELALSEEQHKIYSEQFAAFDTPLQYARNDDGSQLTDEQRAQLKQHVPGTGLLSPEQLNACMRSLDHPPTAEELQVIIDDFDVYAKGGISLQDFLFIMAKREANTALREKLMACFRLFDRDENGFIDVDELKENLMTVGPKPYSEREFEDLFQEMDLTAVPDGQVDYAQLVEILVKRG